MSAHRKLRLREAAKAEMKRIIEENRRIGGSSWKDFTKEELIEIYGKLPYWAEDYFYSGKKYD